MKNKILLALLLAGLIVIIIGYFVYKPLEKELTGQINSEDGQVVLNIKDSALPDHINIEDISIKNVEAGDFELKIDDSPLFAYDLQPSGLYFLEPIDFEIDIPFDSDGIPALYNVSEYGVTKMNNLDITIDSTNKTANIKGTTEHFSYFYVSVDGFSMRLSSPKEANVGQQIQVSGTTTLVRKATEWRMGDSTQAADNPFEAAMFRQWKEAAGITHMTGNVEVGELKYKDPWEVKGKMTAGPANVVAPASIDEAPAKTKVSGNSYTFTGQFACKSPGQAKFEYTVNIFAEMEMEWKVQPPFDIMMEFPKGPTTITQVSNTECKAAPVGEEGIGGGGAGGGGGGDEGGEPEEPEEPEGEGEGGGNEGLEEVPQECPDCEGLEEQLEKLEDKKAELEDQIDDKKDELDDAEDSAEELDDLLDELIKDAGCDPALGLREGKMLSGASSGKVTSRGRDFYCPTQADAEALIDALKKFWETHKSPSQVRSELRKLQKELDKINLDIEGVKKALEDCPCKAVQKAPAMMMDLEGKELVVGKPIGLERMIWSPEDCKALVESLELVPSGEDSATFKIEGEFPDWIEFDPPSGGLPNDVDVKMDCDKITQIQPDTYNVNGVIEVYNKENKQVKGIPVNMIFGIMLTEGEEGAETSGSTGEGGAVVMGPPFVEFVYDHANPTCPLPIDPISVTGPVGGEWVVTTPPPVWVDFPQTSGTIPGSIDMNFPCRLDRYENQEQSQTFTVEVTKSDGSTEQAEFDVKGTFKNF